MAVGAAALVLALFCAAIMGLAIQRGGACTLAAAEELLATRQPTRLLAMIKALRGLAAAPRSTSAVGDTSKSGTSPATTRPPN